MPITLTTQTVSGESLFCDPGTFSNIQFDDTHWSATSNIVFNGTSWTMTASPARMDYIGGGFAGNEMQFGFNKTGTFIIQVYSTGDVLKATFNYTGQGDGIDGIDGGTVGGTGDLGYLIITGDAGDKVRCIFGQFS